MVAEAAEAGGMPGNGGGMARHDGGDVAKAAWRGMSAVRWQRLLKQAAWQGRAAA